MDGLSVAASIAGLVQLADTIFTRLQRYGKAVKHASKDIRNLSDQVRDLSLLLHHLKLVVNGLEEEEEEEEEEEDGLPRNEDSSNLANFRLHHVSSCHATLRGIENKLDRYLPKVEEHRPFRKALRDLKWPFSASDIKELLAEVEAHKGKIHLALSGETLAVVFKALSRQDDLAAGIEEIKGSQNERWAMQVRIQLDKKREDVLAFFCKVDTSSNHRMSLKLRHPLTGLWVTEGLIFQTWLVTRNSKLWLSGIPGAGKTVIAACVIEEAMKKSSQDHAVAYFYCDYKDEEKQKPIEILGSLANQLARQNEEAYSKLEQLYHGCHTNKISGACAPELEDLSSTINEMASCFDEVSIVVDGLDECGRTRTTKVVQLLAGLASDKSSNTRTLFLSRDEPEIRAFLEGEYTHLEIAAHNEDLRLYVAAEMETRQHKTGREQLRIRRAALKDEIMKTLIERADGMFRWVSCQLDYLCSLRTDALKSKALESLPPGLEATYERILQRVNQEDENVQRMVQRTLQWTVSAAGPIWTTALSHAISIEDSVKVLDPDSFYDEEDILMYCSSLIRRSADGNAFEMAHFTVKEYLSTLPIDGSDCSSYSQAQHFVFPQLAITCLSYLLLDCFNGGIIEEFEALKDQVNEYPFRPHAIEYWAEYAHEHLQHDRVSELVQHLFSPSRSRCFLSWARDYLFLHFCPITGDLRGSEEVFDSLTRHFCAGGLKPLHMAAALGLPHICSWLLASNCDANERSYVGTPLHFTLMGRYWLGRSHLLNDWVRNRRPFNDGDAEHTEGRTQVLEMLIANGADCNALYRDRFGVGFSCSYLAFFFRATPNADHPLIKLIAGGAELDEKVMEYIDRYSDCILEERDFVEALIRKLAEMDQNLSFKLQVALKLDSSSSFAIAKFKSNCSASASIHDLIDLLLSAIRFDQTETMEELIRNERLDITLKEQKSITTFLHAAAKWRSIGALRLLLSLGADVNSVDQDGWTALHFVTFEMDKNERHEQCITLLLDRGANVNARARNGNTVWHVAAKSDNAAAITVLLQHCGNYTEGLAITNDEGLTPLFVAAELQYTLPCEVLLAHESYFPQRSLKGLSLVHYAVKMSSITILQMLDAKHFKLTDKTDDGRTGLHFLSSGLTPDIVRLLINSGVDVASLADNGETPLHILACLRQISDDEVLENIFDLLITEHSVNSTTDEGFTPLHYALDLPSHLTRAPYDYDFTEHVEILISRGADVHIRLPNGSIEGETCLTRLVKRYAEFEAEQLAKLKKTPGADAQFFIKYDIRGREARMLEVARVIIAATTKLETLIEPVNSHMKEDLETQYRPLCWFIKYGYEELINLLLEKGVDVDVRNPGPGLEDSWSALNYACWYGCSVEVFRKLLTRSARLKDYDLQGRYLNHLSCMASATPSILGELCKAGLDPNLRMARGLGSTPLMMAATSGKQDHVKVLLDHGADIHLTDSTGWEAAYLAAKAGHIAVVERFVDLRIDWNCCARGLGGNILHVAVAYGHIDLVNFILQQSLINDIDCRTTNQDSALALAASCHYPACPEILRLLLRAGADVDAPGKLNIRPIHKAAGSGNLEVIQVLLENHCSLLPDDTGLTPQLTALKYDKHEAFQLLKEYEIKKAPEPQIGQLDGLEIKSQSFKDETANTSSKELRLAIRKGDLALCTGLIAAGHSISRKFPCRCTPLLEALSFGHGEIARYLIHNGTFLGGSVCKEFSIVGYSLIHLVCAKENHLDILKLVMDKKPSVISLAFQSPVSPLHVAVACGNVAALELLLQHWKEQYMANISEEQNDECGTLKAVDQNESKHRLRTHGVRQLLPVYDSKIDTTNLNHAWFLSRERNISTNNVPAGTPLHLAAYLNNDAAAKLLLDYGASIDPVDHNNNTPLHVACLQGSVSTARLLLDRGVNEFIRDSHGRTPLMQAAYWGKLGTLELLINRITNFSTISGLGNGFLHYGVGRGPAIFAYLLSKGCCLYTENYRKESPVDLALARCVNFPAFLTLIFNLDLDFHRWKQPLSKIKAALNSTWLPVAKFFLRRAPQGVVCRELEATTWSNGCLLGDAAGSGCREITELFVLAGANLELDRGSYGTPLLTACTFGRFSVVKYLVRIGAKVMSSREGKPFSAVEAAGPFPNIVQWLLVERFTEQANINSSAHFEEQPVCPWSGIQREKVEISGLYTPLHNSSSFDRAKELAKLRKRLQGEVIHVFKETEAHGEDALASSNSSSYISEEK